MASAPHTNISGNLIRFDTAMGPMAVSWSVLGLTGVWLPPCDVTASPASGDLPEFVSKAIRRAQLHLAGNAQSFDDIPVDLSHSTDFCRQVYDKVRAIGPGNVLTYGDVARELGKPNGARAIGLAMARNPMPLVIPCHRIVAKNGQLGGFSAPGGVETKRKLLDMEGATLPG